MSGTWSSFRVWLDTGPLEDENVEALDALRQAICDLLAEHGWENNDLEALRSIVTFGSYDLNELSKEELAGAFMEAQQARWFPGLDEEGNAQERENEESVERDADDEDDAESALSQTVVALLEANRNLAVRVANLERVVEMMKNPSPVAQVEQD